MTWALVVAALLQTRCALGAAEQAAPVTPAPRPVDEGGVAELAAPAELRPWPAEAEDDALRFAGLDADMGKDLSGAVWNDHTRTLWVCRNGPRGDSVIWALEPTDGGGLRIATREGRPAIWRGFGDCEALTFADETRPRLFVLVEGAERILELDVSAYGERVVVQTYDTRAWLPLDGKLGAEGLTFIPDDWLERAGFRDADGEPRLSRGGLGGLMLVGHQNGGGLYAFDLDPDTGACAFVGEYRVVVPQGAGEGLVSMVAALEFDRTVGELFIWHGFDGRNELSVVGLDSRPVDGAGYRALRVRRRWAGPSARNYEGLAVLPAVEGERTVYLTIDDGKARALLRYEHYR